MKIAFVSTMKGAPWGGSEELWFATALRALKRGDQVLVSTFDWPSVPKQMDKLRAAGAQPALRPLKAPRFASLLGKPAWLKQLIAFSPDVVVLSQGSGYECAGRRSTRPLIPWLKASPTPLVNVIQFNRAGDVLTPTVAAKARYIYERAAMNAFVATRNITDAEATLGMTIPRARVVRNPVNLADTSAVAFPARAGAVRFASVARLDFKTKGHDKLIDVLASAAWRKRDWTLDLYGQGNDEDALRELITRRDLNNSVSVKGQTSDIRSVWASHHAMLMPSVAEGTPLALVEAMLMGRPSMVTDVGGCADWVADGVEGFLAASPTTEAIAAAMERLWAARDRWPEIGQAARARALRQYDLDPGSTMLGVVADAAASRRV